MTGKVKSDNMKREEFILMLWNGKKAFEEANAITLKIMQALEKTYPDIALDTVLSKADNADSIYNAITYYMQCDGYSAEKIWDEIQREMCVTKQRQPLLIDNRKGE